MEFKYNCLIADDEFPAHEVIKAHLKHFDNLKFAKSVYNGEDAIVALSEYKKYDIAFLDINMPKFNGIEVLQKLQNKPEIIITTAYTDFAFDAYQNDATDYLQKPISETRFKKAIEKVIQKCMIQNLELKDKIEVKINGVKKLIAQQDIICLKSYGNYCKLFLRNQSQFLLLNNALANQLEILNKDIFIQTHRTCIVNINYILKREKNNFQLSNNLCIPIGRKYLVAVKTKLRI
jgi:DNA-binding LytR/AlgR family response regulator